MAATLAKDDPRRAMLLAAYAFRAAYQRASLDTAYWESAVADIGALCRKHDHHPFLMDLLIACYADMEREAMTGGSTNGVD